MSRISLKNPIVRGSLILTAGNILTKSLGFVLRIFMARYLGEEGMGLFQITMPIHGVCFSLCVSGFQTSISRFVAENAARRRHKNAIQVFLCATIPAMLLSVLCAAGLHCFADILSVRVLGNADCIPLLKLMAYSIPFGALHSCILGYYIGYQKAAVPAVSQFLEQLVRILSIFFFGTWYLSSGRTITPEIAMYGLLAGECVSSLYCLAAFFITRKKIIKDDASVRRPLFSNLAPILHMSIPLTANRLATSLLSSLEAILIPICLKFSGLSAREAISVYGIFGGMALPFIMFPMAITSSLSMMLMPAVSKANASGATENVRQTTEKTLCFTLFFGIFCTGVFFVFGDTIGSVFFHSSEAGKFIKLLSPLCPLLSTVMTFGSVLNGLGKTTQQFYQNMASICFRVLCVLILIPRIGITGYLASMIGAACLNIVLHFNTIRKELPIRIPCFSWICKPAFCLFLSIGILFGVQTIFQSLLTLPAILTLVLWLLLLTLLYLGFCRIFRVELLFNSKTGQQP